MVSYVRGVRFDVVGGVVDMLAVVSSLRVSSVLCMVDVLWGDWGSVWLDVCFCLLLIWLGLCLVFYFVGVLCMCVFDVYVYVCVGLYVVV